MTDEELAEYLRADLRDFWYPATARPEPWLREIAAPISPQWQAQRGVQARTFVRAGIKRLLELPDEADG